MKHRPLSFAAQEAEGDNISAEMVIRYASEADAAAAFTYFKSLEQLCNEGRMSADENDLTMMYIEPVSPTAIDGVDRLTATSREIHGPGSVISFDVYGAQVGDALLLALSTDSAAAKELIATLAQRAQGLDAAGPLTFGGPMEPLPGFQSPDYWSWPGEGPLTVRQSLDGALVAELMLPASIEWLTAATDDRIDKLASDACVMTQDLSENDDLASAVLSVYTAEELAASDPETLGGAVGFVIGVYCPNLSARLVLMAEG